MVEDVATEVEEEVVEEDVVVEDVVVLADKVVVVVDSCVVGRVVLLVVVVVAFVVVVHWHAHTPPEQRIMPPDCSHDKGSSEVEHCGAVVEVEGARVDVVVDEVVLISAKVLILIRVEVVSSVSSIVMHPQISITAATTAT